MNIIVPIKQVPNATEVAIDPQTNNLKRAKESKINKYDRFALESALQLAKQLGDEVIAITMGPQNADQVLAEAIGMGVSKGILLSDRAFAGADTLATAYTLSIGISKISDIRLIIVGQQAEDADTGQVGPLIAKQLQLPQATYVAKLQQITQSNLEVHRLLGNIDINEILSYPALLTISDNFDIPRYIMPSKLMNLNIDQQIITWQMKDLDLDPQRIGLSGFPSVVRKILMPDSSQRRTQELLGSISEQTDAVKVMIQEKMGLQSW